MVRQGNHSTISNPNISYTRIVSSFLISQFFTLNMYYGYYGYPDGYNITSDLSVIFDEKIRKLNPSGLAKNAFVV